MSEQSTRLRMVAYRDGDTWVAQCLEADVATHAPDFNTLMIRMEATLAAEVEEAGSPHALIAAVGPAPDFFQAMWNSQSTVVSPFDQIDLAIAA